MPQGTSTLDLQKLSTLSWLSVPFFCHFICLAALIWFTSPGFQGRNRWALTMMAREFIPPHCPSPIAAAEQELRDWSARFLLHVTFRWISHPLSLWPLLQPAAWLLSMLDAVARELMGNFLYWYYILRCLSAWLYSLLNKVCTKLA